MPTTALTISSGQKVAGIARQGVHRLIFFLAAVLACGVTARAEKNPASADQVAMIERATQHELKALKDPSPYQFQERLEWTWGTETRSVIETAEGRADRIILFGDEPLSLEQKARQEHRLAKLLSDRDAVKNDLQDRKAETQRRIRMVEAFPKAFFFDFVRRENGLLRFNFHPNPEFSPKDKETQMYRGMEGTMLIEPVQERIVQVEGKLVKDVSFGWGIFGRLNKGGIYEIAQTQLSPGAWRITTLNVDVKGRMFFVDPFRFMRRESDSMYRPVPAGLTYQAAVKMLLAGASIAGESRIRPSHRSYPTAKPAPRKIAISPADQR